MAEIGKTPATQTIAQPVGGPRRERDKDSEKRGFKKLLGDETEEILDESGEGCGQDDEEQGEGKGLPGDDSRGLLLDEKV